MAEEMISCGERVGEIPKWLLPRLALSKETLARAILGDEQAIDIIETYLYGAPTESFLDKIRKLLP